MNVWVTEVMDYRTVSAMRNVILSKLVEYDQERLDQYGLCELVRLHFLVDLYYLVSRAIESHGDGVRALTTCRELFVEWKMQSKPDRYELVKNVKP